MAARGRAFNSSSKAASSTSYQVYAIKPSPVRLHSAGGISTLSIPGDNMDIAKDSRCPGGKKNGAVETEPRFRLFSVPIVLRPTLRA